MTSAYIDPYLYRNNAPGTQTSLLLGNLARLAAPVIVGALSLTLSVPTTVEIAIFDPVYLFDGPNCEVLQASSVASVGSTTIAVSNPVASITGCQYAHAAGVTICTDGQFGSLAVAIFNGSTLVENLCKQVLWQTTYTNEQLQMPTMRAAINNQNILEFRPRHFPITALTTITLLTTQLDPVSYDPTQAFIDGDRMIVSLPNMQPIAGQNQQSVPYPELMPLMGRMQYAQLQLTYTAGYAIGSLPFDVARSAVLLTNECLNTIGNPVGAAQIQRGKVNTTYNLRGDTTGESSLVKQAKQWLQPYTIAAF